MVGQCHRSDQHESDQILGGHGRQEGLVCSVHGVTKSQTRLNDQATTKLCGHHHFHAMNVGFISHGKSVVGGSRSVVSAARCHTSTLAAAIEIVSTAAKFV